MTISDETSSEQSSRELSEISESTRQKVAEAVADVAYHDHRTTTGADIIADAAISALLASGEVVVKEKCKMHSFGECSECSAQQNRAL